MQLRRLTAREHRLSALILSVVLTALFGDWTSIRSAKLNMAGHTTISSLESALPAVFFVAALVVFLPRTGNESRITVFRFVGRFPLLIRYFVCALAFYGILACIDLYFG
jgi:hypothetical protein